MRRQIVVRLRMPVIRMTSLQVNNSGTDIVASLIGTQGSRLVTNRTSERRTEEELKENEIRMSR